MKMKDKLKDMEELMNSRFSESERAEIGDLLQYSMLILLVDTTDDEAKRGLYEYLQEYFEAEEEE